MVKKYFNNDFLATLTKEIKIETKFFTISCLYKESKIKIIKIMASYKMFNSSIVHTKLRVLGKYTYPRIHGPHTRTFYFFIIFEN